MNLYAFHNATVAYVVMAKNESAARALILDGHPEFVTSSGARLITGKIFKIEAREIPRPPNYSGIDLR